MYLIKAYNKHKDYVWESVVSGTYRSGKRVLGILYLLTKRGYFHRHTIRQSLT